MEGSSGPTASRKAVQYVDFGFTSLQEFWAEIVVAAYEKFKTEPTRANAIFASVPAWHVHEWIWHAQDPGKNNRDPQFKKFQENLIAACPELAWIRDVADAAKHQSLSRANVKVRRAASGTRSVGPIGTFAVNELAINDGKLEVTPLAITLSDGSVHGFAEVLSRVIDYWRTQYFQKTDNRFSGGANTKCPLSDSCP